MKAVKYIFMLVLVLCLAGCAEEPSVTAEDKPVDMVIATDLHYMKDNLTEDVFLEFCNEVKDIKPELLILSGDLTDDGDMACHRTLAAELRGLEHCGISVLVLPGNHDMTISPKEFREAYDGLGYGRGVERFSGSYIYKVRKDLWILMLDTNSDGENIITDDTFRWVKKRLKKAEKEGARVISVSHQNLYTHNSMFSYGYQMGTSELIDLYEEENVLCSFSGHVHFQHIRDEEVPEIVTSALSIYPHNYGKITYDGKELTYDAERLSINTSESEKLLSDAAREQIGNDDSAEDYIQLSRYFFSGEVPDDEMLERMKTVNWKESCDPVIYSFIKGVLKEWEEGRDNLHLTTR